MGETPKVERVDYNPDNGHIVDHVPTEYFIFYPGAAARLGRDGLGSIELPLGVIMCGEGYTPSLADKKYSALADIITEPRIIPDVKLSFAPDGGVMFRNGRTTWIGEYSAWYYVVFSWREPLSDSPLVICGKLARPAQTEGEDAQLTVDWHYAQYE